MAVAERRAPGLAAHHRTRHAEHLGGDAPSVLDGLAHDEMGTPGVGQREQVRTVAAAVRPAKSAARAHA